MAELGQIHRPFAESFSNKRKLYCVANIYYSLEEAPDEFKSLVNKYWDEVVQQIDKMEAAGKITKIFCDIIYQNGEEALNILLKIHERIPELIKKKLAEGSILLPLENKDILGPYTDWGNCLRVVLTQEVFNRVFEFYTEFSEKRLQHILNVIDTNLSEAEAGLLIMKDDDRVKLQFPKDIEVFLITPPSYDDIIRWLRDSILKKTSTEK
jgi:hypothetical protein